MKYFNNYFYFVLFLLLTSCYSDSNIGPSDYNKSQNILNADISGNINLHFNAKSIYFDEYTEIIKLSATMINNPFEIYSLDIAFPDSANHYQFDLKDTDTLTNFKVYFGHIVKEYYFRNISGEIDITKRRNDTVCGEFSFDAQDSLLNKSISIKNGSFFYIKKKYSK